MSILQKITILSLLFLVSCQQEITYQDDIYQKPPIDPDPAAPFLSATESMKTMYLPAGFKLELVASEPLVEEPTAIAFDGNGKMYVAEMLTYMQDIDGTNRNKPWSRVSVLEDLDGDGKMDKRTTFVDSLVLPRNLLPLDDQVLISETYSRNIYSYRDTDGDNIADEKILVYADSTRFKGNLEHQAANLTWNIDNNLYLTRDAFTFRWDKGQLTKDTMPDSVCGQYGLTQNETGTLVYSRAGGEVVASGFQQPSIYGSVELEGQWADDFEEPWPIIGTPDVQGGAKRLRPDNTLNKFTGVSGQEVFLGNRLPAYGDLFIPEPVGRLIRRAKMTNVDGKVVLSNPYEKTEFMASTDSNFRPVQVKTGPDGALYIVDMYRGIIQESNWVKKGSYLRPEVERRNLEKNIGKGRIYRIVHEQMPPMKMDKLLPKTSAELLPYLGHANGWYRFNAQKLLVVREATEAIPALKSILIDNESFYNRWFAKRDFGIERLHALWTLDGLKVMDKDLILQKINDADTRVQNAAIRLSERFLKEGDTEVFKLLEEKTASADIKVLIQIVLSLKSYSDKEAAKILMDKLVEQYPGNDAIAAAAVILTNEAEALNKKFILEKPWTRQSIVRGHEIYKGLCGACHGKKAEGVKDLGPALAGSARMMHKDRSIPTRILLDGLSGPIDGKEYGIMTPMKTRDDEWIADVMTYIRKNYGNAKGITVRDVKRFRKKYKDRDAYWTIAELEKK